MLDWLAQRWPDALTAIFTGATLVVAVLAYRKQQQAEEPVLFVDLARHTNALTVKLVIRNRADHPIKLRSVRATHPHWIVRLAEWSIITGSEVGGIHNPLTVVSLDETLWSKGNRQGLDTHNSQFVLIAPAALTYVDVIAEYDSADGGGIRTVRRRVHMPREWAHLLKLETASPQTE